ncbi:RagB/SusD family nutrient uptake outer membrane protein [Arachidicoccus terrestris]|uniref:RagB/SusD family nutrient uptake outer membrane protein n=1 Tax=Arachidicoccus terrestris TaxID=2875539 RepID=UPI001CC585B4|nr:RagB/SusD family nutrient uptake outer membrane protein [Arachidicoccus terrestris]UAY55752.1 RagB/SusD family nutrient uptake outer membrane protein [Arachidicoccus terrestris]
MITKYKFLYRITLAAFIFTFISSCRKFIEVDAPVTSINSENVYRHDNTAISVLTGMYAAMYGSVLGDASITSMSLFPELSSDMLSLYNLNDNSLRPYYQNDLNPSVFSSDTHMFWNVCYSQIYIANAAIEGLKASTSLSPSVKKQLIGEAHFMRAFYFFYLVNLYGDVPLTLSTDSKINRTMGRMSKENVYKQIIADGSVAKTNLSDGYKDVTLVNNSEERIRPNKATAEALLARAYLYTKDYVNAEKLSTEVINNSLYSLINVEDVFLKNSKATIWSAQPIQANVGTWEGYRFPLPATGPDDQFSIYLSNNLIHSFEPYDYRLAKWTGNVTVNGIKYYYAYKYKAGSGTTNLQEYTIVFRLAEQYLIRAEARVNLGKLTGANSAVSDLDSIRNRAGLPPTTVSSKEDLLNAILHERQVEFFTEWGHRWLDLKRLGKIDEVMSVVCPKKGGTWASYKALYPIPQSEIDKNPGMNGQQNPGYAD